MTVQEILQEVVNNKASDLHLISGFPPILRVTGELRPASGEVKLTPARTKELVLSILSPEQKELLLTNREIDFSYTLPDGGRFRINAYFQKGSRLFSRLWQSDYPGKDDAGLSECPGYRFH